MITVMDQSDSFLPELQLIRTNSCKLPINLVRWLDIVSHPQSSSNTSCRALAPYISSFFISRLSYSERHQYLLTTTVATPCECHKPGNCFSIPVVCRVPISCPALGDQVIDRDYVHALCAHNSSTGQSESACRLARSHTALYVDRQIPPLLRSVVELQLHQRKICRCLSQYLVCTPRLTILSFQLLEPFAIR